MSKGSQNWMCDGIPKDGKSHQNSPSPHEPFENFGPFCSVCGLPKEAVVVRRPPPFPPWLKIAAGIAVAAAAIGGMAAAMGGRDGATKPSTATGEGNCIAIAGDSLISEKATNKEKISQGERVLILPTNPQAIAQKQDAAKVYATQDWERAIEKYELAASSDPNDPETKIYLNNAQARKQSKGTPRTLAVAIPISSSPDEAKEILRGVALSQDQFNKASPTPSCWMEVVLVDVGRADDATSIADDLSNAPSIMGVLGHGSDDISRAAVEVYQDQGLTVLSPLTMSVSLSPNKQSVLKETPYTEGSGEMLDNYLTQMSETLLDYARQTLSSPPVVAVFFNSDVDYSKRMKDRFIAVTEERDIKVTPLDITSDLPTTAAGNAENSIVSATQSGANTAFLAMTKDRVSSAIALAKANDEKGKPLMLLGADELYGPAILTDSQGAIENLVLAIPWRWTQEDQFAQQASAMWRGRVSWRTATAFDAMEALAGALREQSEERRGEGLDRAEVNQKLRQGMPISGAAADFDVFVKGIPLVKAVKGSDGPPGSEYQFDPIESQ